MGKYLQGLLESQGRASLCMQRGHVLKRPFCPAQLVYRGIERLDNREARVIHLRWI
ncbi:MAG TPA: hypothetical protein ACFYD6_09425 [Candidatus Brocadiia bacterium]